MNDTEGTIDFVHYLQREASQWLGISFESLQSSPTKSGGAHYPALEKLLARLEQVPPPPLQAWAQQAPKLVWTAKKGSGQKTWCLLNDRKLAGSGGEVGLERAIAAQLGRNIWAQVPTISGFKVGGAKKRSIDLVEALEDGAFRAYELKTNPKTNTPVYGVFELITYGLFYHLIRSNKTLQQSLHPDSQRLLTAKQLEFCVIAPEAYYAASFKTPEARAKLAVFGKRVSQAFAELGGNDVAIRFEFRVFDKVTVDSFMKHRSYYA